MLDQILVQHRAHALPNISRKFSRSETEILSAFFNKCGLFNTARIVRAKYVHENPVITPTVYFDDVELDVDLADQYDAVFHPGLCARALDRVYTAVRTVANWKVKTSTQPNIIAQSVVQHVSSRIRTPQWKALAMTLMALTALGAAAGIAYGFYSFQKQAPAEEPPVSADVAQTMKYVDVQRRVRLQAQLNRPRPTIIAQGVPMDTVSKSLNEFRDSVVYFHDVTDNFFAQGIAIGGQNVIINHHNIPHFRQNEEVIVKTKTGSYHMLTKDCIRSYVECTDVALLVLPKQVPPLPSIVHRFITDDDIPNLATDLHAIYGRSRSQMYHHSFGVSTEPTNRTYLDNGVKHYHVIGLTLPYEGRAGDCGTPIFSYNTTLSSRNLIGMHSAGGSGHSVYTIITQETIRDLGATSSSQGIPPRMVKLPPAATEVRREPMQNHVSRKTAFRKTPFYAMLNEPLRVPAQLTPLNGVDPLETAYAKTVHRVRNIDPMFKRVADGKFKKLKCSLPRRMLSMHEAVFGAPKYGYAAMDLKASPGYPWTKHKDYNPKLGKASFISDGTIHPDVVSAVGKLLDDLRHGRKPASLFADALKDELRPIEKVRAGKTRIIHGGPIEVSIVGRMLFGPWVQALEQTSKMDSSAATCAVGLTHNDSFLQEVIKFREQDYDSFYTDIAGYDMSLCWELAEPSTIEINKWYNDDEQVARYNFVKYLFETDYIVYDIVYTLGLKNPSGQPITSQLNSTILEDTWVHVIMRITKRRGKTIPARVIRRAWFAKFYGDDSLVMIPKSWNITFDEVRAEFALLGIEITDSQKNTDGTYVAAEQTFLKRTIAKDEYGVTRFLLPLPLIWDQLNYAHKSNMTPIGLGNTARNMLIEAARHGKTQFDKLLCAIESAEEKSGTTMAFERDHAFYADIVKGE